MSATTTNRIHQPWCRDHYTEDDHADQGGWCHHTLLDEREGREQRMGVSIQPRLHDEAEPAIDCYVNDDKLSADEARRMAAALLRAAAMLEATQ